MIEIRNLNLSFGSNKVLRDLDLDLEPGQIVGLVGPNGCGKTSLFRIFSGLEMTYKGQVSIFGRDPSWEIQDRIAYQPDHLALAKTKTGRQAMAAYETFYKDFDLAKCRQLLEDFHIDQRQKINSMSKGMQEKVQVALTLSRQADIYILDEPISGVDPVARREIVSTLLDNFTGSELVLISTHMVDAISPLLDRLVFLKEGRVALNEEADILRADYGMSMEEVFEEVYK